MNNNKEYCLEQAKEYRIKRPDVQVKGTAIRRARIELNTTEEERAAADRLIITLKRRKNMSCSYCDCDMVGKSRHIDHIEPLSRGSRHVADNLCVTCQPCNSSKSNRLIYVEWWPKNYREKFLLTLAEHVAWLHTA